MIAAALVSATAVLLIVALGTASAGEQAKKPGTIKIESWLAATPNQTQLAGTVKACFKLSGALHDTGGKPSWTPASYEDTTAPAGKCKTWAPVGGFLFVPPATGNLSTLYAVHTITGQKGSIFITFAGAYDLVSTYQGSGSWVITGGTGAYNNLHGEGTWTADASRFPHICHTEIGQVWTATAT